jgi:transposase
VNQWFALMRNRWCCMRIRGLRLPCSRDELQGEIMSTCAAEQPTSSAASSPRRGHFTKVTPTRSSPEFADFLLGIAEHYPAADTIHLVMDNLSTHSRKALVERFGEEAGGWLWNRFTVHYTPKHGSWLNQAEIEISVFSRQCLGKRRIGDIAILRRQTKAWNRHVNRDHIAICWKFTRKQARRKMNYAFTRS